jgi:phosphatidylserine/phosphatidylglycerophosphate/cardiolipin synthase-like enzyme
MIKKAAPTAAAIDRIIRRNLVKLARPGVLSVRPGFEITNHQLTGRVAIVAMVHTKTRDLPAGDLLPQSLGGIRVDVREATAQQRLRASDPAAASLTQAFGRPENAEPRWPYERELPGGRLLTSSKSRQQTALAEYRAVQPAVAGAIAARLAKPEIPYVPAPGQPLAPLTLTTTITACVSPDAGFATLTAFLGATRKSLVVGMYDFTSGPLLRQFISVLSGKKTLQLVLDNPAPNPTRNQTDSQTVAALDAALKGRARIVRALTKSDTLVTAWMFPSAYHIKVIVRDDSALWLSSGNLNNSNEPDPASPPATEDRDWHVIIENPTLAALFTAYLNQDFASAKGHQASTASAPPTSAPPALGEAIADAAAKLAAASNPLPPRPTASTPPAVTAAATFNDVPVTITPLLTPDNLATDPSQGQYLSTMLGLIGKARKSLYIQLQYIESSAPTGDYTQLLQAIAARIKAGVDVRLIESLQYGERWAEKMKAGGVDLTANIALQPNVHNKGFVIDSAIVVVSSQNFSPEGVRLNRDAGVIIENASIAQYFEKVFLADWTTRAKPFAPTTAARGRRSAALVGRGKSAA